MDIDKDARVIALAINMAQTACRYGDQIDFLEVLSNFALEMAGKHQEPEQQDDTARRLLDY